MMAEKPKRPRSFRTALDAWPDRIAALQADPGDDTLGALCALLDAMDGEIVRTWKADGHEWRVGVFAECRAAARQANRLVTAAALTAAQDRGQKAYAARLAKAAA